MTAFRFRRELCVTFELQMTGDALFQEGYLVMFVFRVAPVMICRGIYTSVRWNGMKAMISAQQQVKMMKKFMAAANKRER